VGCATLVHTVEGTIVNIEGDPRSPHSEGTLCPKGAATYQLHVNPNRPTRVLHRAPGATEWEVWDLERAMDRVAWLTKRTRDDYLAGAMSRWNPWLTELMPELFVELSPELAREKSIANLDWVHVTTPRGRVRAKALVTSRLRPFAIAGQIVHHVGMPWHWGYDGLVTGDVVNELTSLVGDPNVTIHEGKAFVCNVEKA
jgi:anaerobic selenocysteine-containing dehydrogenase